MVGEDKRFTTRVLIVLRLGIFVCDGSGRSLRAASASRKRSTMPDSARACLPLSDGSSRSPSVAAVLPMVDSSEAVSTVAGGLRKEDGMSMVQEREESKKRDNTHDTKLGASASVNKRIVAAPCMWPALPSSSSYAGGRP